MTEQSRRRSSTHRTTLRDRVHLRNPIRRDHIGTAPTPFVLRLTRRHDHLVVNASSAIGHAEALSPMPDVASRDLTRDVMAGDTRPWKIASRAGERLYAAVFPPPIAQLLQATVAASEDTPVPIVLQIDDSQLAALPWELLRDPERERFLTLSTRTPLSRATAARPDAIPSPPWERSNLRVTLLAESVEERALRVTSAIAADARVDVHVNDNESLASRTERPHVLLVDETRGHAATIPRGIPLVVIAGNGSRPGATTHGEQADLLVPATMSDEARETFAIRLASALADGRPLDVAVASARRAVADKHSVVALDWAEPVLVAANPSRPLVTPIRSAAAAAGVEVAGKTVGWLREAIGGSISAVLFLIAGLLIYRLGFSTSNELSLDLLSPFDLFSTFKGMILALSTYQDTVLLVVAALLVVGTALLGGVRFWRRRHQTDEPTGLMSRLISPLTSVRVLSFLTIATLTVAGAYLYQQYLWRVVLPIPDGALGIAVTREAAAASIREDLAGVLYNQGQVGRIVVRDLPVAFDGGDTEKARKLGKRIGAKAVLIYREIERGDVGKQYSAYVVFTDPSEGLTIGESNASGQPDLASVTSGTETDLIQVREGVEIPALRTDTVAELVSTSAGVIAYNQNRFREAITLFEQALSEDPSDPNQGMLNYYLGECLRLDGQAEAAATVLERAITFYETRQSAAVSLTASDEFILVQSYFSRGWIAGDRDVEGYDDAIIWYGKALPLRDRLLARAGELERPFAVRALFSRIYTQLAEANRRLDRTDEQQQWEQRALDELDLLAQEAPPNDSAILAQEAGSRFFVGDCVGSSKALQKILVFDPDAQYALFAYGIVQMFQGRLDLAEQSWSQVLADHPDDASARENLVNLLNYRGLGDNRFFEPSYLERAEELWREFLEIDPANEVAHDQIADSAGLRASAILLDSTAQAQGDDLVVYKSQQLWPTDPQRRADAIAVLDIMIQERRILATEIHPNQPAAEVALASAYDERQGVSIRAFPIDMGEPLDFSDPILSRAREAVLADAAEITEWTSRILAADSGATRVERLQAWSIAISSASRLWTLAVLRQDYDASQALIEERQRLLDGALVDAGVAPASTTDEALAIYSIYSEGYLLAFFAKDPDKAAEFQAKMLEVVNGLTNQQDATAQLDATICREDRDLAAGNDALATGNLTAASDHYNAALTKNPEHLPALIARSSLRVRQGDVTGAIDDATKATTVLPSSARGWSALVHANLAAGNADGANAALTQFLQVTGSLPSQERMIEIRDAIKLFAALLSTHPDQMALVRTVVVTLNIDLDAMPDDYATTYQYSQLYAELGALALDADDAVAAEPPLRRAIDLDPHETASLANLALAILVQGRDAMAEIDAAIADTRDELWQLDPQDPTGLPKQLLSVMSAQTDDYLKRFPGRGATVQPLVDAIAAAREQLTG